MTLKNLESEAKEALEIIERNVVKSEKIIDNLLKYKCSKSKIYKKRRKNEP